MPQLLVIMQGVPGSGKSTLARDQLAPLLRVLGHQVVICSTDDLFIVDGAYRFDRFKLHDNHRLNQERARLALEAGQFVIVDNTNVECWQVRPYVAVAVQGSLPVSFHRATGAYPNVHGVPLDSVQHLRTRLQTLTVASVMGGSVR